LFKILTKNVALSAEIDQGWPTVLNMIRSPDRDPTGFCVSEPDPDWTGFWKKLNRIRYGYPNYVDHCNKMLNPLSPAIAKIFAQGLQRYNLPADW